MLRDAFFFAAGVIVAVAVPAVFTAGQKLVTWAKAKFAEVKNTTPKE